MFENVKNYKENVWQEASFSTILSSKLFEKIDLMFSVLLIVPSAIDLWIRLFKFTQN